MLGIGFRTSQNNAYLYHSGTNRLLRLDGDALDEINSRSNGERLETPPRTESALALWKGGFLDDIKPASVSAVSCERTFRSKAWHAVELFVLELTQRCTLRCQYCVYSEWCPHWRTHGALDMSIDTALRAVDYYFEHNYQSDRRSIGFYGGEPLLKFDMFPEIMTYARQKEGGQDVAFHMTTNGLLMNEAIADFCIDEEISITFSLDGPKEEHDRYRSTPDGNGSFDNIMRVCMYMKKRDPAYCGLHVGFNAVFTPSADLTKLEEFFNDATGHELVRGQRLRLNYADPSAYGVRDWERNGSLPAQIKQMNQSYIQMLIDGTVLEDSNSFVRQMVESPYLRLYKRPYFKSFGEILHRCGMCLPAVRKTYVDIRGGVARVRACSRRVLLRITR